jgi:hypothetical protein
MSVTQADSRFTARQCIEGDCHKRRSPAQPPPVLRWAAGELAFGLRRAETPQTTSNPRNSSSKESVRPRRMRTGGWSACGTRPEGLESPLQTLPSMRERRHGRQGSIPKGDHKGGLAPPVKPFKNVTLRESSRHLRCYFPLAFPLRRPPSVPTEIGMPRLSERVWTACRSTAVRAGGVGVGCGLAR